MVKGTTQQAVVVRVKGSELFEEALFLVRPGAQTARAVTDRMLLDEARRAAAEARDGIPWRERLLAALAGAGAMGLLWLVLALI